MENNTLNSEFEIVTGPAPDYANSCRAFIKDSHALDSLAIRMVTHAAAAFPVGTPEGRIVGKTLGQVLKSAPARLSHSLKQNALRSAAQLPFSPLQNFFETRSDTLSINFADKQAALFAPIVGPGLVATILPRDLKTEAAAAFMYKKGHYALKAVIDFALDELSPS